MPESTTSDGAIIRDATTFDLKTVILLVSGALGLAGSWGQVQLSMARMQSDLDAKIVAVAAAADASSALADKGQDARLAALEYRIASIQANNCAIARKLQVPTVGCGRREDDP